MKSSGFSGFKSSWGNRPDVDNWRRMDAVSKQTAQTRTGSPEGNDSNRADLPPQPGATTASETEDLTAGTGEISYDALKAHLPLTDALMQQSNTKIADAFFNNGVQFQNVLEDYNAAIDSYDSLIKRFPDNEHVEEALFNMYYCYQKLGRKSSADSALNVLNTKYRNGKFATLVASQQKSKGPKTEDAATKAYEKIYDLFISGKFEEAKVAKAAADSLYGNSYWTPQLLYIESIYYVSKREDSVAIETLTSLISQFAGSPLATKAQTMIDVLKRRSEIETYLTNLQITRLPEDEPAPIVNLNPVDNIVEKKEIKKDSVVNKPVTGVAKPQTDTMKAITGAVRTYVFNASDQQFVGIILTNVDPVYANETRNAFNRYNQANFYNLKINVSSSKVSDSMSVVLLGPFIDAASALIYVDKVKPKTSTMIIPWLKPEKYSFTIISQPNLDVLTDTKDMNGYKALMEKVLPGKF